MVLEEGSRMFYQACNEVKREEEIGEEGVESDDPDSLIISLSC